MSIVKNLAVKLNDISEELIVARLKSLRDELVSKLTNEPMTCGHHGASDCYFYQTTLIANDSINWAVTQRLDELGEDGVSFHITDIAPNGIVVSISTWIPKSELRHSRNVPMVIS